MKKIITFLITFLFLTNCGYTPIYSSKNFDFRLEKIISLKSNQLNSKIQNKLQSFSNHESKRIISLEIDAEKKINTLAKNSKGDASRYEMIIKIELKTIHDQNQKMSKSFQEKFNYNTNPNKFDLNRYEKEIENLLIDKNIDRIIVYLSKI